ncbi:smad nuclear interacting protein 1-like [Cyanocitta cristata]
MERGRPGAAPGGGGFSCPAPRMRTRPQSRGSGAPRPRSRSGRSSRSPQHGAKQEREGHCGERDEERKQRRRSEQEHRRCGSGDRDRHRDRSDRKNPSDRPGARSHERDMQSPLEQQAEREFCNERRREHPQSTEGSGDQSKSKPKEKAAVNKKPSFELSGALLEDTNTFKGLVIKYSEPPEARIPRTRWRLYPFRNEELLPVMHIHRQSAYLLGRHRRIADIPIDHPSCSKQHAVFQYRLVEYTRADGTAGRRVRPYIIDLGSGNGTFLNNQRIEPQRYYELREKDVLRFGFSSREYVLLHESSDKSEASAKDDDEEKESDS